MTLSQDQSSPINNPSASLRRLIIPIYLPSMLMAVAQMALLIVLPLYILDLGSGVAEAAFVFAMRSLGSVLVNVPASLAISQYGHRPSMAVANVMMGLSAFIISISTSSWIIAISTLVFGAGMGTWLLARLAYITGQLPNHRRGTALATLAGLQRLGMFVGPLLGGLGIDNAGYSTVFAAISLTALVTAALVWRFASSTLDQHPVDVRTPSPLQGFDPPPAGRRPAYSLFTLIPGIIGHYRTLFATAGTFVFALQLVREQRNLLMVLWGTNIDLDAETIGLIVSTAAAVDMAMFPLAGYIMDHWGRKVAGVSCIGFLSIALGLLPLTSSMLPYLLAAIIAGIGNGFGSGIILTMGADLAPKHERSQFLGVWRFVGDLGALAGPLLTSLSTSLIVALELSALVGLTGGLILLCCVAETLSRRAPQ